MTRIKRLIPIALVAAGLAAWAVACKQQEGERCQINSDCEEPLVCNQATQQCSNTTGGGIDASVPDGPPADAAVDAMPDAMIDAMIDAP